MADLSSFETIQNLYFALDVNFTKLFAACQNEGQQNQLKRDYVNSRDAFWEARNRSFMDDDPLVASVVGDLSTAEQSIDADLNNLQNVVQILNTVESAVNLASRLIALGATVI